MLVLFASVAVVAVRLAMAFCGCSIILVMFVWRPALGRTIFTIITSVAASANFVLLAGAVASLVTCAIFTL